MTAPVVDRSGDNELESPLVVAPLASATVPVDGNSAAVVVVAAPLVVAVVTIKTNRCRRTSFSRVSARILDLAESNSFVRF